MNATPASSETLSAVVTGGARGIGRAIAERLVHRGYAVVLTDIDGESARRTASGIGAVEGLAQDVRDEASHAEVAAVAGRHGRLAVWVNNAGVGDPGSVAELSSEAVNRVVDVNLKGVLWGMRAALEAFGGRRGDIVNISSLSAMGPVPGLTVYAATKAAVLSATMSAALEAPRQVGVHVLCPDGVDTVMVEEMPDHSGAKALVHSGGGLLTVDQVAEAAIELIGSKRVVRSLPGWRGPVVRIGSFIPSRSRVPFKAFEMVGRRVMKRQQRG
jgi:NAD(P)-dependent dehydrogenase (short-subunit alcohol dehydrogenase family)